MLVYITLSATEGLHLLDQIQLEILGRLANIIQLVEVFETQERVYMVMELATGGELFDRIIAKGSFTERDATRVLWRSLDGQGVVEVARWSGGCGGR